jgi:hypothetical protein
LKFAELSGKDLLIGIGERVPAREHHLSEIQTPPAQLESLRSPAAQDREHPLYRRFPEAWLDSQVRQQLGIIDPTLLKEPFYGQVPAFAGGERGVLGLLGVDRYGRLTVLELKASVDLHLPMRSTIGFALIGIWIVGSSGPAATFRASRCGPIPRGCCWCPLRSSFTHPRKRFCTITHPSCVERIGLGVEWRRGLAVMFRLTGAQRPR